MSLRFVSGVLACLALTACIMYGARAQDNSAGSSDAKNESAGNATIQKLLQERHQVLQQRVDVMRGGARQGSLKPDQLLLAEIDVLRASLELASDQESRIKVRSEILENFRKMEEIMQLYRQSGTGNIQDFLLVKADRIAAEIALARERAKTIAEKGE